MKTLFIALFSILAISSAKAQTDSTLQQYTGKYKFAEGNPVTEITISLDNGVLTATASIGSSELKKIDTDVFQIVSFDGKATFKRNSEGKVSGIEIEVGDTHMEGKKEDN